MSFMKKNINMILLISIVLIIASFAGFTHYYKSTFQDLAGTYKEKVDRIDNLAQELSLKKQQLNSTLVEYQIKEQREQQLSEEYTDIRGENIGLKSNLQETRLDLADARLDIGNLNLEVATLKKTISKKDSEISELKSDIEDLEGEIDNLEDDIDDLNAQLPCP